MLREFFDPCLSRAGIQATLAGVSPFECETDLSLNRSLTMSSLLDRFAPTPQVQERQTTLVRAPADLVQEVARNFDLMSIRVVRAIFWLRGKVLRAKEPAPAPGFGLVAYTQNIGWGVLLDQPGRAYVSGAACRPWEADVHFSPIPAEGFSSYAEPEFVKIVWSLETEPVEPALTRLSTETRVVATDERGRVRFRRYWLLFGIGIVMIRWFLLPSVRREAERQRRMRGKR